MIKRRGEINGVIFRNQGYCPYNMAIKYKLSYKGEVYFVYVDSYKELKEEIMQLTGGDDEQGNEEEEL